MTRYEVGFMSKCAEYGLAADEAVVLMKSALSDSDKVGLGGLAGMGIGAAVGVNGVNKAYGQMARLMQGAGASGVPKLTLLNKLMLPSVAKTSLKGGAIGAGGALGALLISRLMRKNNAKAPSRRPPTLGGWQNKLPKSHTLYRP